MEGLNLHISISRSPSGRDSREREKRDQIKPARRKRKYVSNRGKSLILWGQRGSQLSERVEDKVQKGDDGWKFL